MKRHVPLPLLCLFAVLSASAHGTQRITYLPTDEIILNPDRGIYHVRVTGMVPGKVTPYDPLQGEDLARIRRTASLVFRYFGLKEWRTVDLPPFVLRRINADFEEIRNAGLKCIVRFCYSANIGEPDASLEQILRHLDQLKPLLRKNKDVMAVMQAGFIGAWGEWHSSTNGNDSPKNRKTILFKILDVLPRDRMVQVRTPHQKQQVFSLRNDVSAALTPSLAFNGTPISRVGHHNDCFLADAGDMGTYMRSEFLDTLASKAYLQRENRYVPMGGETCKAGKFSECPNALREMARLRWSFLNGDYDEPTLAGFTTGGCMEEIKNKLGYRFRLLNADFASSVNRGGSLRITLRLMNTGWASPYNPRDVQLIVRHAQTKEVLSAKLDADPRRWLSDDTITVSATVGIPLTMRSGSYSIFLNLPDLDASLRFRPEYSIRLANLNTWEQATGYNNLLATVQVVADQGKEKYRGKLWLKPI